MQEKDLIARAKAGDSEAFGQLVLQHQDKVYTLAFHMVNDREDAADLAQEAFLKAWKNLDSFQGESAFSTWLHRLTTNVCLDYLRKQARRRDVTKVVSLDDEESGWSEPADYSQDPQEQLVRQERKQAVHRGLRALPEHHRQMLVMREISGLSYQEIAQVLDVDLGTVKSRIARARNQLRKILLEEGNLFHVNSSKDMETKQRR